MRLGVASELPGEDSLECRELLQVRTLVEVEDPLPGRAGLVVVVPERERDLQPRQVRPFRVADFFGVALFDLPREDSHADAVGRAAARHAVDTATRADRIAVARLEIAAPNLPRRSRRHEPNLQ